MCRTFVGVEPMVGVLKTRYLLVDNIRHLSSGTVHNFVLVRNFEWFPVGSLEFDLGVISSIYSMVG